MWPFLLARHSRRANKPRTLRFDLLEDRRLLSISMKGLPIDLGSLGGDVSEALGVNGKGQVVGESAGGDGHLHAFFYDGTMHDLGTLGGAHRSPPASTPAGRWSAGPISPT